MRDFYKVLFGIVLIGVISASVYSNTNSIFLGCLTFGVLFLLGLIPREKEGLAYDSVSSDISALAAYAGKHAKTLHRRLLLGMSIANDITVEPNIKHALNLTKLIVNNGPKPYTGVFQSKGNDLKYSGRVLTVNDFQRDILVDPKKYRTTYLGEFRNAGEGEYTISVDQGFFFNLFYRLNNVPTYVASNVNTTSLKFSHSGGIVRFSVGKTGVSNITEQDYAESKISLKKTLVISSKAINFTWDQGSFDGSGNDVSVAFRVRTPKIYGENGDRFIILLKPGYRYSINGKNYVGSATARVNKTIYSAVGYTINGVDDFFRISVSTYTQDSDPIVSDLSDILIYKLPKRTSPDYTMIIASYDSSDSDKNIADFVCNENNADRIWNAGVNINFYNTNTKICAGTYNLNEVIPVTSKGVMSGNDGVVISYNYSGMAKGTTITGSGIPRGENTITPYIYVSENITNSSTPVSVVRASSGYSLDPLSGFGIEFGKQLLKFDGGFMWLNRATDKPVILIDGFMFSAMVVDNMRIYNDTTYRGVANFTSIPKNAIAVRGTQGSNNGVHNKISKIMAYGFHKGFDIGGEHFILEDCLAHHCYYGFAFADYLCRPQLEHPIMMIGCSIEQCFFSIKLGKYGYTTLSDIPSGYSRNQTLICTGLSTENEFITSGLEAEGYPDGSHPMRGIVEVIENTWRGTIEMDSLQVPIFENGRGRKFKQRYFNHPLSGTTVEMNNIQNPTYLQGFFNTTENKNYIYNGTSWI